MPGNSGLHIIKALRWRWTVNSIVADALLACACTSIIIILLVKLFPLAIGWAIPVFAILFTGILFFNRAWQIKDEDVAKFLNKKYSSLEESCGLLLKPAEDLNLLESLQVQKTNEALQHIARPKEFVKPLRIAALTLLFAGIVGFGLAMVPFGLKSDKATHSNNTETTQAPERILPGIKGITVTITPPAYIHAGMRTQQQFNLHIEEGAAVAWQLKTSGPVSNLQMVFNDSSILTLKPAGTEHNTWQAAKKFTASGFYQVVLNGAASEFYKIEVVKDQPPVITMQSPKPNITIDFGEPQKVDIKTIVTDDYGVKDATIMATVASGSGEAVKFKEQQINFGNAFAEQLKQYNLQKLVELAPLGMHPGDELYFFIKAHDNNNQEKRSDIFIVSIADTAQLMESDVLLGNMKLKPEYFRSERQIIIETEQLLRDKDTLTKEEFNTRSNNLGIDQKLLRLRYGKFLGEEAESNDVGGDANEALSDPTNFGNAGVVLDAFTDKHDNAEDASFFNDEIKKQLKATLTEMWNAELRLRTFKPQEALPFEYKALRLLKDLQQKSRVYVAKTSYRTTPLKPEKRLTADLSKILQPQTQTDIAKSSGPFEIAANALSVLEQLKFDSKVTNDELQAMQQAMQLLSNNAATNPGIYLPAYQAQKKITEALQKNIGISLADIQSAENGLQQISAAPGKLPQKNTTAPANQLQQQYFKNLQKTNRQ